MRAFVIRAIFWRNFVAYFSKPTGYVFITVFLFLGALLAFFRAEFFKNNLATLDTLSEYFPWLLVLFVPMVTMSAWAEERLHGTDELLLTLPVRDLEVVLGKYLACLGIYTVALAFSVSHLFVLAFLGQPDAGLMVSTYFSYWLLGAALLAAGMVGSSLTSSLPIAFILGLIHCAVLVGLGFGDLVLPPTWEGIVAPVGITAYFTEVNSGVLSLRAVLYFSSLTGVLLYLNLLLLSRRRWTGGGFSFSLFIVLCLSVTVGFLVTRSPLKSPWPWVPLAAALGAALWQFILGGSWDPRAGLAGARWGLLAAALVGVNALVGRARAGMDATAEKLHTLSPETRGVLSRISPDEPVYVHAYVSPEVPKEWVQRRATLIALLRDFEALGGGQVQVKVYETEKYTPVARDAKEKFGIEPQAVGNRDEGESAKKEIYLGVAVVSGARETVVPFLYKGLSVEYELTRSIRAVSGQARRKIGILSTDARLFGGITNFQTFQQAPEWQFVAELRRQYEVVQVMPGEAVPDTIDALVLPLPSSLTDPQLTQIETFLKTDPPSLVPIAPCPDLGAKCKEATDKLKKEGQRWIVAKGKIEGLCAKCAERFHQFERYEWPVLVLEDPLPWFDPSLAPWQQKRPPGGMMFGNMQRPEPKGDVGRLFRQLGVQLDTQNVVWHTYNPYPDLRMLPFEFVFVGSSDSGGAALLRGMGGVAAATDGLVAPSGEPFAAKDPISSGLQSMVFLYTGMVRPLSATGGPVFTPLVRTSRHSGIRIASRIRSREDGEEARGKPTNVEYTLAARVKGKGVNAVVIADLDLIGDVFFNLRRDKWENKEFDNITFVLNCVDALLGDESTIGLRKRRPKHRVLELIETEILAHDQIALFQEEKAEENARTRLREAQDHLDAEVRKVEQRPNLDDKEKERLKSAKQEEEQRKFNRTKREIEDEKEAAIEASKTSKDREIKRIQRTIRTLAVVLPPLPALLIGVIVFFFRFGRERQAIPKERWVKP